MLCAWLERAPCAAWSRGGSEAAERGIAGATIDIFSLCSLWRSYALCEVTTSAECRGMCRGKAAGFASSSDCGVGAASREQFADTFLKPVLAACHLARKQITDARGALETSSNKLDSRCTDAWMQGCTGCIALANLQASRCVCAHMPGWGYKARPLSATRWQPGRRWRAAPRRPAPLEALIEASKHSRRSTCDVQQQQRRPEEACSQRAKRIIRRPASGAPAHNRAGARTKHSSVHSRAARHPLASERCARRPRRSIPQKAQLPGRPADPGKPIHKIPTTNST